MAPTSSGRHAFCSPADSARPVGSDRGGIRQEPTLASLMDPSRSGFNEMASRQFEFVLEPSDFRSTSSDRGIAPWPLARIAVLGLHWRGLGVRAPGGAGRERGDRSGRERAAAAGWEPRPGTVSGEGARGHGGARDSRRVTRRIVEIDANQFDRWPLTINAGPIESIMLEPMGRLGGATRLYGRVWTSGPRVVIRYYWAQRVGGSRMPICAVARLRQRSA